MYKLSGNDFKPEANRNIRRFLPDLIPGNSRLALDEGTFQPVASKVRPDPSMEQLFDGVSRRSAEHTSELQSLMRISYAVFCLTKNITTQSLHILNDSRILQ